MTILACVIAAVLCCALVVRFRHNLAETRIQLAAMTIIACIPLVNVLLVVVICYVVFFREPVMDWFEKPFK